MKGNPLDGNRAEARDYVWRVNTTRPNKFLGGWNPLVLVDVEMCIRDRCDRVFRALKWRIEIGRAHV